MSSVDFGFKCPQCSSPDGWGEHDSCGSETGFCDCCGYRYSVSYEGDFRQTKGHGSYQITGKQSGTTGCFLRHKACTRRARSLARVVKRPRVLYVTFTTKVRGKWKEVVLKDVRRPAYIDRMRNRELDRRFRSSDLSGNDVIPF